MKPSEDASSQQAGLTHKQATEHPFHGAGIPVTATVVLPHPERIGWELEASQVHEFRAGSAINWMRDTAFQFGLSSMTQWLPN